MAGANRPKTGGRKKGTPNKDKQELLDAIQAHVEEKFGTVGWDPVLQMAVFAADEENEKALRLNAAKEVAQYVKPKLKAIEMSGPDGGPILTEAVGAKQRLAALLGVEYDGDEEEEEER